MRAPARAARATVEEASLGERPVIWGDAQRHVCAARREFRGHARAGADAARNAI